MWAGIALILLVWQSEDPGAAGMKALEARNYEAAAAAFRKAVEAAPDDYAARYLPDILARFAATHPDVEVEALCERVAIIKEGEILALDTVANLVLQQENPVRLDFLPRGGLSGLPGEVRSRLSSLGVLQESQARAGELTLFLKDLDALKRAVRELEPVELDRMAASTANLEDVFVRLTGARIMGEEEEVPAGRAAR